MTGTKHTPGRTCDECEGFCLQPVDGRESKFSRVMSYTPRRMLASAAKRGDEVFVADLHCKVLSRRVRDGRIQLRLVATQTGERIGLTVPADRQIGMVAGVTVDGAWLS